MSSFPVIFSRPQRYHNLLKCLYIIVNACTQLNLIFWAPKAGIAAEGGGDSVSRSCRTLCNPMTRLPCPPLSPKVGRG